MSTWHRLARLAPWNVMRTLAAIDELPILRTQIEQCRVAYRSDAKSAARLEKALKRMSHPRVVARVRDVVHGARLESDPCPHVVLDELLPDEAYDELVAAIPPPVFFEHLKVNRQDLEVPFYFAPRYHREVWQVFHEGVVTACLRPALVEKFRDGLDAIVGTHWPALGSLAGAGLELHPVATRLMRRRPGYEIRPHRDPRWAFLTCIVYLTRRDDPRTWGTQLCRLRREREAPTHSPFYVEESECELVRDVPGRPNSALVFLNSTGVHRASIPLDAPAQTDRYVYQLQLGPDPETREALLGQLPQESLRSWGEKAGHQPLKRPAALDGLQSTY